MITTRIRRRVWPAFLLAGALVVASGSSLSVLGADAESDGEAVAADASPAPESADASLEPAGEAVSVPAFDPASVDIRLDLFLEGFEAPVQVTDDGTGAGCIYIVERGGLVYMAHAFSGVVNTRPFLDISGLVRVGAEQGLHSIAFHPDFKKNGRFFAHYTGGRTGASVVAEFKGKPCKPSNSKPRKPFRLTVEQPFPNNNGGWMDFGPDGNLYVALGDGGGVSPGDPNGIGQSKSTQLAKILRLDVDRGKQTVAPSDNPYAKKRQGFNPMTWAWGLRDPRHASFDRETGDLWIGDVGQDRFEEVDLVPAGSVKKGGPAPNFGWSDMEGDQCHNLPDCDPSQYTAPVYFYDKVTPHGGITGGYVYRGASMPELQGIYIFSDRLSGYIWGIDADAVAAGQPATAQLLLDAPQGILALGEDDDGELFAIAADGSIFRIAPEEG